MSRSWIGALILVLLAQQPFPALAQSCAGDCNNDGGVTIDEIIKGVGFALETIADEPCRQRIDRNNDGVTIDEIIVIINYALAGCPPGGPTPTATATQTPEAALTPSRTPAVPGCNNGTWQVRFTNAVATNATTTDLELGLVAAGEVRDPRSGRYVWMLNGLECKDQPGVYRNVQLQFIGETSGFKAGTYAVAPPLRNVVFTETEQLATVGGYIRIWTATSGSLVIESAAGGGLSFHLRDVTLTPNTIVSQGGPPTGTFTLAVDGAVTSYTSN